MNEEKEWMNGKSEWDELSRWNVKGRKKERMEQKKRWIQNRISERKDGRKIK